MRRQIVLPVLTFFVLSLQFFSSLSLFFCVISLFSSSPPSPCFFVSFISSILLLPLHILFAMENTKNITELPLDIAIRITQKLVDTADLPHTNLINFRLTCKFFNSIGNRDEVKEKVKLSTEFINLYIQPANDTRIEILKNYTHAGNPEAAYVLAVLNIAVTKDVGRGLTFLRRSATKSFQPALSLLYIMKKRMNKDLTKLKDIIPNGIFEGIYLLEDYGDDVLISSRVYFQTIYQSVIWNAWDDTDAMHRDYIDSALAKLLLYVCLDFEAKSPFEHSTSDQAWGRGFHVINPANPEEILHYQDIISN